MSKLGESVQQELIQGKCEDIYYANPENGQKGYYQLPNPPDEADDPNERPVGAPQVAQRP